VLYPTEYAFFFFLLHRIKRKGREREKERNGRVLIGGIMLRCSLFDFSYTFFFCLDIYKSTNENVGSEYIPFVKIFLQDFFDLPPVAHL
jgi:hypothetical protein